MFNNRALRKNTYLHAYLQNNYKGLDPFQVNQYVNAALNSDNKLQSNSKDLINIKLNPPHPKLYGVKHDPNKLTLAFGSRGLPKLLREMSSTKDKKMLWMSLNTLTDLLKNPLDFTRAIRDYKLARRFEFILLENLSSKDFSNDENLKVLELLCENMDILTDRCDGATALYMQKKIMFALFGMIPDKNYEKFPAARILSKIASFPMIADSMIEDTFYHKNLFEIISCADYNSSSNENTYDIYMFLSHLIARRPVEAYNAGYYCFLFNKIQMIENHSYDPKLDPVNMKSFAHLLSVENANVKFLKQDGVKLLYELFKEDFPSEMLEYIALAFQNCTTSNRCALYRCREFWDLPILLIQRACYKDEDNLQLYCLQTLRQITVMPCVKNFVRKVYMNKIKKILTNTEIAKKRKMNLLNWLQKKNYKNVIENPYLCSNPEPNDKEDVKGMKIRGKKVETADDNDMEINLDELMQEEFKKGLIQEIANRLDCGDKLSVGVDKDNKRDGRRDS